MARRPRPESPTNIYHVMARGNNKEKVFSTDYYKKYMLRLLKEHMKEYEVELYAYCVMDNHMHILIRAPIQELSKYMAKIMSVYAMFYNHDQCGRIGYVFQDRFKSECIDTEQYFWTCLQYIHLNPVKAGIKSNIYQYFYSSALEYKRGNANLIHPKALKLFQIKFGNILEFNKMHESFHTKVFVDVYEDKWIYYQEITEYLVRQIQGKYKLPNPKLVFDAPKFRGELKREMKGSLCISASEIDKLINWGRGIFKDPPSPIKELV